MVQVLVVGGGHAGLEAALAAARVGASVRVVTGRSDTIGQTPCNPSVGGVAKGHLVREVEALGGFMGRAADACAIHGRLLNRSKGPAVRSTRLQVDKQRYGWFAQATLRRARHVEIIEGLVVGLTLQTGARPRVTGVVLADGSEIKADAVVVTTGTFLGGVLHTGERATPGGRVGEAPASGFSQYLRSLGFRLSRLKTGTPPRLDGRTIRLEGLEPQPSDEPMPRFVWPDDRLPPDESFQDGLVPGNLPQVLCHLTWTNERTHDVIAQNLHRSPMYSGRITAKGPRYCPSIEDKVVRFADRPRHQVFLEPEGLDTHSVYPSGISTSLPAEVQQQMIATMAGLEHAVILRPGYAVEYDAIDARALDHRLASKDLDGLFFAGQVNGTSGYEEAAAQGLVAGANAALAVLEREPLRIGRDQGYAGVMVDDLVTQGCDEPYRMFTARAEYRICLREDNADGRLAQLAFDAGLIDGARCDRAMARASQAEALAEVFAGRRGRGRAAVGRPEDGLSPELIARAEAIVLYRGYEGRMRAEIERGRGHAADLPLAPDLDYASLPGLATECAQRFAAVRPASTAQAARIPGVTPAALACLWVHARMGQGASEAEL